MPQRFWLVKSEPDSFSIDDLARAPRRTTFWDGVRNYQARNLLRDQMQRGDRVLFYHSSCDPPAVVGVCTVVREGYPDSTAWDPAAAHYDPQSTPDDPRWYMVDLRLDEQFNAPVPLERLRAEPALARMELLRRGSRLSVQPVQKEEFEVLLRLGRAQGQ